MSLPLEFHGEVRADVDDAWDWHERQAGLGRDFLRELQRSYAVIRANPARFGYAERDVREGVMNRFSYAIYYRVLRNRIRVLAVWHTSRDPAGWQSRV